MRNTILQRILLLLVLPLLMTTAIVVAQSDADPEQADKQNSAASQSKTGEDERNADAPAKQDKEKWDVFIPSEEISEDLSVSFPVDI